MIKLISIEDEKPVISAEARTISVFKKIIERDRGQWKMQGDSDGRKKILAMLELSFIYFFADPRSQYTETYAGEDDLRTEKVKRILGLPEDWKPDALVKEAIEFYVSELKEDFDIGFLEDALLAAKKTREYFRNVDYDATIQVGKSVVLKYKIKEVTSSLKEVPSVIENLKIAREKAFKSEKLNTKVRGGGAVGRYE